MGVESSGYRGASYEGELDGTCRGVLDGFGNMSNMPYFRAAEAKTSTSHAVGSYDIDVVVDGNTETITGGGLCLRPSDPFAIRSVDLELDVTAQQFYLNEAVVEYVYESMATGSMNVQMDGTGPERVGFSVDQAQDDEHEYGQWEGLALAWDMVPTHPQLIQAFVLE